MSAETQLYAALSGAAGVTALVSTRIYPDAVPQEQALPSMAYARLETEYVTTIHGSSLGQFGTFEVVCMAEARDTADAIADAVVTALGAQSWQLQSRRQEFDGDSNLWGTVLAVRIFTT